MAGCGDKSTPPEEDPSPPSEVLPADPSGILLPGDDGVLAVDAIVAMLPSPVEPSEVGPGFLTTRLEAWIAPHATVAEVNAALEANDARIVSMRAGLPLVTLVVNPLPDLATAEARAAALTEHPAFILGLVARPVRAEPVAGDGSPRVAGDGSPRVPAPEGVPPHLASLRAPAAWNALSRADALGHVVRVLVADNFTQLTTLPELPGMSFAGAPGQVVPTSNHGWHVSGIIGARHGDAAPVGVHPAGSSLLQLIGLPDGGLTWGETLGQLVASFPASGRFVVNTSLGWAVDPAAAATGHWPTETLVEGAAHALAWRIATAAHWPRYVHATAAGNERGYGGTMADGRRASPFTIARFYADPRDLFAGGDLDSVQTVALDALVGLVQSTYPAAAGAASNVIVVGSSDGGGTQSSFSNDFADVRTEGEDVLSSCAFVDGDCDGVSQPMSGTSMATPQVAGLAAWLWNLAPSLGSTQVVDRLVRSYTAAGLPGILDAYLLTLSADPSLAEAPVRRALLDVAGDSAVPGSNGRFDEHDVELFLLFFESFEAASNGIIEEDFSRYDLNGDGITGHGFSAPVDLDVDGLPELEIIGFDADGTTVDVDEAMVSDREVLCYYAFSDLYEGDAERRAELLDACTGDASLEIDVVRWLDLLAADEENELEFIVFDAAEEPVAGASVTLTLDGGQADHLAGVTDADGRFETVVRFTASSDRIELEVTVEHDGDTVARSLACDRQRGRVVVVRNNTSTETFAHAGDCEDVRRETRLDLDFSPLDLLHDVACAEFADGEEHSANVTSVGSLTFNADPVTLELTGFGGVATATADRTATGLASSGAVVFLRMWIEVEGAPVRFTATGTMSSGDGINDVFALYEETSPSTPIYREFGRDGTLLELDEEGFLPPGVYHVQTDLTVHDWFSGNLEFEFNVTP
jgi:subtilisin family serine protease